MGDVGKGKMMELDKLREAWPAGLVAMRGVQSIGGALCIRTSGGGSEWVVPGTHISAWVHSDGEVVVGRCAELAKVEIRVAEGDLLPNVDPADTATWTCLLLDLAQAAGWTGKAANGLKTAVTGLVWRHTWDGAWVLRVHICGGSLYTDYLFEDIETVDPALALVEARIQRQTKGDVRG